MQAVDERLVRRDHDLIQLLDPPFAQSDLDDQDCAIRQAVDDARISPARYAVYSEMVEGRPGGD